MEDFKRLNAAQDSSAFSSVIRSQADQLLAFLDRSEELLNPYGVKNSSFSWWNGEAPLSPIAYEVPTTEGVKAAVAAQTARLRELAEAARPALNLLSAASAHPRETLDWANVLEDFKSLDEKKPNPITSLETFLQTGMDRVNPDTSCLDSGWSASGKSADLFVSIGNRIHGALLQRCQALAKDGYAQIASDFDEHLAGRFPFADYSTGLGAAEADPNDIIRLFAVSDRYAASAREALKMQPANPLEEKQLIFLKQIAELRPLFSGLLAAPNPPAAIPGYELQIVFRTNRAAEIGGDQIIGWQFDSGAQSVAAGAAQNTLSWHVGDPVRVSFRFAKNSPLLPVAGLRSSDQVVANRTVSFEYSDAWALFRLIQLHESHPLAARATAATPIQLSFYMPTAPDPANLQAHEPAMGGQVRVYLQLTLRPSGAKDAVSFPEFPVEAPALTASSNISASN